MWPNGDGQSQYSATRVGLVTAVTLRAVTEVAGRAPLTPAADCYVVNLIQHDADCDVGARPTPGLLSGTVCEHPQMARVPGGQRFMSGLTRALHSTGIESRGHPLPLSYNFTASVAYHSRGAL